MKSPSHGTFDGPRLLREQAQLLDESTPADINYLQFLKLKLNAQQRATAQRNQHQRREGQLDTTGAGHPRSSMSAFSTTHDSFGSMSRNNHAANERSADLTNYPTVFDRSNSGRARGSCEESMWEGRPSQSPSSVSLPAHQSTRLSMNEGSARNTAVCSTSNPLEDLPASVAKRRSMGDGTSTELEERPVNSSGGAGRGTHAFDEMPAVAAGYRDPLAGISEQPHEEVSLEECPHCGRTFAPGRLTKHIEMCRRQREREEEQSKRKPVGRSSQRGVGVGGMTPSTTQDAGGGVEREPRKSGGLLQQRPRAGAQRGASAKSDQYGW